MENEHYFSNVFLVLLVEFDSWQEARRTAPCGLASSANYQHAFHGQAFEKCCFIHHTCCTMTLGKLCTGRDIHCQNLKALHTTWTLAISLFRWIHCYVKWLLHFLFSTNVKMQRFAIQRILFLTQMAHYIGFLTDAFILNPCQTGWVTHLRKCPS